MTETMLHRNKQFAQAVAADIVALVNNQGDLASLATTSKATLVAAINELKGNVDNYALMSEINDAAIAGNTAWSSLKTKDEIDNAKAVAVNTAQTALDTALASLNSQISGLMGVDNNFTSSIQSLITALQNNSAADLLTQALAMKAVRYDIAQSLTSEEKLTARTNIGATSMLEVVGAYGDPDFDIATFYGLSRTAALAGTAMPAL